MAQATKSYQGFVRTNGGKILVQLVYICGEEDIESFPISPDDLVTIETMPEYLRASHRAAGNWGEYPHNGATRRLVHRDEADEIVAADADEYDHIVDETP